MLLSLVIPCYNGVDDTRDCIRSLLCQQRAPELEILVVDNNSSDATQHLDQEFAPHVRVLRQPTNLGFAGGVNQGLRAARGEYVVVLNNDTRAAPHLLQRLILPLQQNHNIAMTGPVSNFVKGPARLLLDDFHGEEAELTEIDHLLGQIAPGKVQDVDSLAGLCLAFHRSLLDRVGLFDSRFGIGNFEDDDFSLRIRLLGLRLCIARDAFLFHHGHRTFKAMKVNFEEALLDRQARFAKKWQNDPAGRAVTALLDGDLPAAARHAEAGLRVHPKWPDGNLVMARQAIAEGKATAAVRHLRNYLALCPANQEAWLALANQLINAGADHEVGDCLRECAIHCFLSESDAARLHATLGLQAMQQKKPADAQRYALEAIQLDPTDGAHFNLLGISLLEGPQAEQAEQSLRQAIELGHTAAWNNLANWQWRQGDWKAALHSLARFASHHPDDPSAAVNIDRALNQLAEAGLDADSLRHKFELALSSTQTP